MKIEISIRYVSIVRLVFCLILRTLGARRVLTQVKLLRIGSYKKNKKLFQIHMLVM